MKPSGSSHGIIARRRHTLQLDAAASTNARLSQERVMLKSRIQFWSLLSPVVCAPALVLLLGTSTAGVAQEQSASLTFSEDIAPILFESCVGCHQPNGIGPMSLLSYDDVRPYVSRIKRKV